MERNFDFYKKEINYRQIESDLLGMRAVLEKLVNFEIEEIKKEQARVKKLMGRAEFFEQALRNKGELRFPGKNRAEDWIK